MAHDVRLRTEGSPFSEPARSAVDLPAAAKELRLESVTDGETWTPAEVTSGYLSVWIAGLPENAESGNVGILIDGRNQEVCMYLRPLVRPGTHELAVECGGTRSNSISTRTC